MNNTPNTDTLTSLFSHLYEVKELDSAKFENTAKAVVNKLAMYVGAKNIKSQTDVNTKTLKIGDSVINGKVRLIPNNEKQITVDATTTVGAIKDLNSIQNRGNETVIRLSYDEYSPEEDAVDAIVEKVRIGLLSGVNITALDENCSFAVKVFKASNTFTCTLNVKGISIAKIDGKIKYGIKQGNTMVNSSLMKTLYPTVRLIITSFIGPKNVAILKYLVAYVNNAIGNSDAFALLDNPKDNRELITLLSKMGVNIDLKDISKLKKLYDNSKIVVSKLDFDMTPNGVTKKICVDGTINGVSTVVTAYEATIDNALTTLMPKPTEDMALLSVKNFNTTGQSVKHAKGFTYIIEYTTAELKNVMNSIQSQTGTMIAGNTGNNLFGFDGVEVNFGGSIQNNPTTNNALLMQMMQQMMGK